MDVIFDSELEVYMNDKLKLSHILYDAQVKTSTGSGFYIFDFVVYGKFCKLVVECDGDSHQFDFSKAHDAVRDLWCIQNGFHDVLRYTGEEIRLNINQCIERIRESIAKYDTILNRNDIRDQFIGLHKKDIEMYLRLSQLPIEEKRNLTWCIQRANADNIVPMTNDKAKAFSFLESEGLIIERLNERINQMRCIKVLPDNPRLLCKLKYEVKHIDPVDDLFR